MKIWLTKNSEVSIRDQLVEQITLGIASADLKKGERLPSVRDLARRFRIHSNTASAAYRELVAMGLVEFRKGSGVFVTRSEASESSRSKTDTGASILDLLITRFLSEATSAGYTSGEVQSRIAKHLEQAPKRKVVVVESDYSLREIIVEELADGTGCDICGIDPDDLDLWYDNENVVFAAMFDERAKLTEMLGGANRTIFLKTTSVSNALNGQRRPQDDELVAVVSGWRTFISLSRLFLIAAKIAPDSILTRHTAEPEWHRGIEAASIVIGDVVSVKKLGNEICPIIFRIISDESIDEIRNAVRMRV